MRHKCIGDALQTVSLLVAPQAEPYDIFSSMLLILCVPSSECPSPLVDFDDNCEPTSVLFAAEPSPRAALAYYTFMLCKNTPVRQLLAVAGESWVMAEKILSHCEYTEAQVHTLEWAQSMRSEKESMCVERAISHANAILRIHHETPKTGLLFQEWAVYLASLVLWVRVHVQRDQGMQSRLSMPNPTTSHLSPTRLNERVAAVLRAGPTAAMSWTQVLHVLLWVKSSLEMEDIPHHNGLVGGALDVLGRLVSRGNEDGWF